MKGVVTRPRSPADGAPDAMPEAPDQAELKDALEAAGWKLTPQRTAVYDALRSADGHPTAEEVYRRVQEGIPTISLATVYKALEALAASGLAAKLADADGTARFDARRAPHYHLRCLRSGAVEDLPTDYDPDLIAKLDPGLTQALQSQGFRLTGYRLELLGYFDGEPVASGPGEEAAGA
jgi:Fe2+ or Zn2+ uptake regulation protein